MMATTHAPSSDNWLIFRIGRIACAVPATSVATILLPPAHLTALPGADAGRPGLFHHGSATVAAVDLRHRFGLPDPDLRAGRLLLGHLGTAAYAFWVDSIIGLREAAQLTGAPLPPELPHNVFTAALFDRNEIVLCSELSRLLAMPDAGNALRLMARPAETAPAPTPPSRPAPTATAAATPALQQAPIPQQVPTPPPTPRAAASTPSTPPAATPPPRPATPRPSTPSRPAAPPAARPAARTGTPPPRPVAAPPVRAEIVPPLAPPPLVATDEPRPRWGLILLALALLGGGGWWALDYRQPAPPVAIHAPAPPPPAKPAPEPTPPPQAAAPEPVTEPATLLATGKGITVQQDSAGITIVIERERPPAPAPLVTPEPAAAIETAAPAPAPPPPAEPEPPQMYVHTVVRGDTLWAIAEHYLDDPWRYRELAQLSRIKNPDLIYPGNTIRIIIR